MFVQSTCSVLFNVAQLPYNFPHSEVCLSVNSLNDQFKRMCWILYVRLSTLSKTVNILLSSDQYSLNLSNQHTASCMNIDHIILLLTVV